MSKSKKNRNPHYIRIIGMVSVVLTITVISLNKNLSDSNVIYTGKTESETFISSTETTLVETEAPESTSESVEGTDNQNIHIILENPTQAEMNSVEYSYYIENSVSEYQYPELPTGCEATALTALLNFWGMEADKVDVAMEYMPRLDFYFEDGEYYGADFNTTFAGDPSSENGYGCYVPCLMTTAYNFMSDNDFLSEYNAINLSESSLDALLINYVANDIPVLVISTEGLLEPYLTDTWTTPDGYSVTWQAEHHAMVIYGYDYINDTIYVMDPTKSSGSTEYDLSKFEYIYNQKGQNAMIIEPK